MNLITLLLTQIGIMFVYMAAGYLLCRYRILDENATKGFGKLLIWCIIPAVMIKSFCVVPDEEHVRLLLWSFVASLLINLAAIIISKIIYPKAPIDQFAATFSNAGFIGIPLVQNTIGPQAVFSIVSYVAILNVLQYTYGVAVLKNEKMKFTRETIVNPIVISAIAGIVLFFSGIGARLPEVLMSSVSGLASVNSPLAMMILGSYVASSKLKEVIVNGRLYVLSAVRLLLIPLLSALLLSVMPLSRETALALLIVSSAPVGANVAVYSQLYDLDYGYASHTVVISTLLSILSVPLIIGLVEKIGLF